MMNEIDVVIYSYKSRYLQDTLRSLYANSSGKRKVGVKVIDQHPLDRKIQFEENFDCLYKHVFWDWQRSPLLYKKNSIRKSNARYFLILSDNTLLSKNWDDKLIEFVSNNDVVVSGNKSISLSAKNLFYVEKKKEELLDFGLTQFIDKSFIFGSSHILKALNYPDYLKHNGEEEAISLELFTKGVDIYAAPTSLCSIVENSTIEDLYVPFSLNHNYNEVINLFQNSKNRFTDIENRTRSVNNFSDFHGFDFKQLKPLPFLTNDVEYDPNDLDFNRVDARRFVARTRSIH